MLPAIVAAAVTAIAMPLVVGWLHRRQVLDHPNERSSHVLPTPRGGGLAPALGILAGLAVAAAGRSREGAVLSVAAGAFGVIGFVDDLRAVPALRRLLLQSVAACAGVAALLHDVTGSVPWRIAFFGMCCVWVVSYVNAFNFMDGINGISAVQVAVAGAVWAVAGRAAESDLVAVTGVVAGAAAIAFVPWNFPTARVFLGDVGSYFLGSLLALGAIIAVRAGVPPLVVLAPLCLYLGDTSTTILRRVRAGETWHSAHRSHAYQRLVSGGWSHARTTLLVLVIGACSGAVALAAAPAGAAAQLVAGSFIAAITVVYLCLPRLVQRGSAAASPGGAA